MSRSNGGEGREANPKVVQGASAVQYSFLGCFGDNSPRAIPNQLIQSDSSIMTVELCAQAAQTNGYTIFGLQVGKEPCPREGAPAPLFGGGGVVGGRAGQGP